MAITIRRLALGVLLLSIFCLAEAARAKTPVRNNRSLMTWLRSMRSKRQDDGIWKLTDAIPGEPDRDYPILSEIPDTDFTCNGKHHGYYADIGARCQVFRICANTAGDTSKGFAFLCPNGTLFNQQFFVCDWYRNVDCENSERYYNLNDQLGNTMGGVSRGDMMDSAREIIMFPQQTPAYSPDSNDIYTDYPSQLGSPLGINGGPSRGSGGPSQGGSGFGQPSSSLDSFPSDGFGNGGPSRGSGGNGGGPSRGSGGNGGGPSRGSGGNGGNGGTVFVNNLGQLSTDRDSIGFDPKASFFLKPEKDSKFDQDSFDPIKGIENSYSFGFPDGSTPIRGSADLSEPVDPNAFPPLGDEYLPPHLNGQNQKQLFTYPHDDISPEYTGQINTELAAQSPKYEAPGVYGPAVSQPSSSPNRYQQPSQSAQQNHYQQPNIPQQPQRSQQPQQSQQSQQPSSLYQQPRQPSAPSNSYLQPQQPQQSQQPSSLYQQPRQPSAPSNSYLQPQQSSSSYQQPQQSSGSYQQPQQSSGSYQQPQQPSSSYQQPQQPSSLYQQPSSPSSSYQQPQRPSVPSGLYQQPHQQQSQQNQGGQQHQSQPSGLYQQPQNSQNQQQYQPQQPQPFRQQSPQSERRQYNVPQNNQQNGNGFQRQQPNGGSSNGGGQSNQEYLRNLLKDKTHIHEDKQQLTELIQRFFVPAATQERVVSTEVFPSPAKESFSFTYGDEGQSSNSNKNYQQPANSGNHQHSGNCGHQGYHY